MRLMPSTATDPILPPMPGQRLARGVARLLVSLDHAVLTEFVPARGLRVDLISLGPKGELWIVECKSSRADFACDRKWQGYLDWCDRYFWAVDGDFPAGLLPDDTGLILADPYGAEIRRMAPEARLAGARRNRLMRDFARAAALRLQRLQDPEMLSAGVF
ncbi:MmcB family DNA repair protein [Paracoccus siganidrum]